MFIFLVHLYCLVYTLFYIDFQLFCLESYDFGTCWIDIAGYNFVNLSPLCY